MKPSFVQNLRDNAPAEVLGEDFFNHALDGYAIFKGNLTIIVADRSLRNAIEDFMDNMDGESFEWTLFKGAQGWDQIATRRIQARMERGPVPYDLELPGGEKAETKFDHGTKDKGNLFVETESAGVSSGIKGPEGKLTKYWAHCIANDVDRVCAILIVPSRLLEAVVDSGHFAIVETTVLKHINKGCLIPFSDFVRRFSRAKESGN